MNVKFLQESIQLFPNTGMEKFLNTAFDGEVKAIQVFGTSPDAVNLTDGRPGSFFILEGGKKDFLVVSTSFCHWNHVFNDITIYSYTKKNGLFYCYENFEILPSANEEDKAARKRYAAHTRNLMRKLSRLGRLSAVMDEIFRDQNEGNKRSW